MHRVWASFHARLAFTRAAFHVLVQWHGFRPNAAGFVPLSIAELKQRSTSIPAGRARRGRVILLMADRVPIFHIADTVGISRRFVYKWVQRFLQEGVAGLADKPGRGRRAEPGVAHVTANC